MLQPEHPANTDRGSGREAPTPLEPLDTVRAVVVEVLCRGEILYWQAAADWLAAERAKVGMEELHRRYPRQLVRALFTSIAAAPGSNSRLVCHDGAKGDSRERELCLFPNSIRDEYLVDSMLPALRNAPAQSSSNQLADKDESLESMMDQVVKDEEGADARMYVVRAAGRIVRGDVESEPAFKCTPGTKEKHRHADELAMKVKPPRETLLSAYPPTLVGLYQSMKMPLYREITASETEDPGKPWVWEIAGQDGRHPATSGGEEGEDIDGQKRNEAKHIDSLTRDRRSTHRRLLMMCAVVVEAILRGRHMASHDIKAAQWPKSKVAPSYFYSNAQAIKPEGKSPQQQRYAFIQKGSTKNFSDMKAAIQRILAIWRGAPAGRDGAPFILGGDEETYKHMYHVMAH
ncbi:unnamed protein product [Ectocarpus sp. CCAP 1310/34]|nr:unnamed protein product [Ectocarpus sp. CCAP 1310/34]